MPWIGSYQYWRHKRKSINGVVYYLILASNSPLNLCVVLALRFFIFLLLLGGKRFKCLVLFFSYKYHSKYDRERFVCHFPFKKLVIWTLIIPLRQLNLFLSRNKENFPKRILHIFLLLNVPSAMSQISGIHSFVNLDLSQSFLSWACVGKLLLYVIIYIYSKSHRTHTFPLFVLLLYFKWHVG